MVCKIVIATDLEGKRRTVDKAKTIKSFSQQIMSYLPKGFHTLTLIFLNSKAVCGPYAPTIEHERSLGKG